MRFLEIGGRVEVSNIPVYVHHGTSHFSGTVFRSNYYWEDRRVLENAWLDGNIVLSKRRHLVESFDDNEILTVTQGQNHGMW
jgi:hypothetical protein